MSVDIDTLNAVITESVNKPATQTNLVETLRNVFIAVPEIRQPGLLLQLTTLAKSPGFSKESLLAALAYLREGQRDGIPPSEYGLHVLMSEQVKE